MTAVQPRWSPPQTGLVGVLLDACRAGGGAGAVQAVWRERTGLRCERLGLQELLCWAERAAAVLRRAGVGRGDRILLAVGEPRVFAAWFVGAIGSGIVAVAVPAVDAMTAKERYRSMVARIVVDCAPRVAVVECEARWMRMLDGQVAVAVVQAGIIQSQGVSVALEDQPLGSPACLQYTSGSTGAPKGAVITHGNLSANLLAISAGMGVAEGDRMVSWLPLHHDMGLVGGLLWPLFAGIETFVMSPLTFLATPVEWLRAISIYGGTLTVAPNFAYSVCGRKVASEQLRGLELSKLRLALCGAEPIDAAVVRTFVGRFSRYGLRPGVFYPVYGLAEATLAVAFPVPGADVIVDAIERGDLAKRGRASPARETTARVQEVVCVGTAMPGHTVEIFARDGVALCGEREVGEIVVRGPSVSGAYWADGPGVGRTALRTGDLGYLAEGKLYVVDRVKDVINIAGEKYAPADIEAAVSNVPGVRLGRVAAVATRRPEAGTEGVALIAEVDGRAREATETMRLAISRAVNARTGVTPEVVLVEPGTIEKTSSGKVRRGLLAMRYQAGELVAVDDSRLAALRRLRLWRRLVASARRASERVGLLTERER